MPVLMKRLFAALTVVGGILAGATPLTCIGVPAPAVAVAPSMPLRAIPDGLAKVATTDVGQIVSIVAADIDDDGDLDVVASDSSLQLHVWVNDGAGHFTLQHPARSTGWQPMPPAPSVQDRQNATASFTQINPPTLGPDRQPVVRALSAATPARISTSLDLPAGNRLTRTPRAPPATTLA